MGTDLEPTVENYFHNPFDLSAYSGSRGAHNQSFIIMGPRIDGKSCYGGKLCKSDFYKSDNYFTRLCNYTFESGVVSCS